MRADRLVATVLLLQSRGRVTAAELAAELEISVATARRDLEALSTAGVPVYPQPGRGGGWSLVGGARTDLSGLTAAEAQALFLLAGPATAASPEVKSALRKLVRALPSTFRADAEAAAQAVVIDSSRWSEPVRKPPALVDTLQPAVVRRLKVRFDYTSRSRDSGTFLVDPLGLVAKDELWYLVAGTADGERTFRLDRMTAVEVTDLPAERPADFDLNAAWQRVVEEVEEQRSLLSAVVLVDARLVFVLRGQFGRHCELEAELDDGRARVRVAAPTPLMVAQHLAGWGAAIEVVEPSSVRDELSRIGHELLTRNAWT
ncbi:MAG: WYL domain-containing protein [Propionibacteriaceae bacterium]